MSGWNHVKFEYYPKQLLSNFEAEIIILPQATEAEIKNWVAYKNKNVYLEGIIEIYIRKINHKLYLQKYDDSSY